MLSVDIEKNMYRYSETYHVSDCKLHQLQRREYLVLSDLKQIQPMEGMKVKCYPVLFQQTQLRFATGQLDLAHLGTLFALDRDHDGRVSLDDLIQFSLLCTNKATEFQPHEFQMQVTKLNGLTRIDADRGERPDARPLHAAYV